MRNVRRLLASVCILACAIFGGETAAAQDAPRLFGATLDRPAMRHALDDATTQARVVAPDLAAVERLAQRYLQAGEQARFVLDLLPGVDLEAEVIAAESRATGTTVHARIVDIALGSASLTYESGVLVASISVPGASYFVDRRADGAYRIARIAEHLLGVEAPPIAYLTPDNPATSPSPSDIPADSGRLIDIMVVWTPAAQTAAGGLAAIQALAQASVDNANLVFLNSGVAHRLRLVHRQQVAYTELTPANFFIMIADLAGTADGQLDEVHALRNAHGADLVSLFVVRNTTAGGVNGIANMPIPPSDSTSDKAFSVVDWFAAIPGKVFVHEISHNLAANHDPFATVTPVLFPYSHGMIDLVNHWRTVMSYRDECSYYGVGCPLVDFLSNPNLIYGGVAPLGTPATNNNAHTLNKTGKIIAAYRPAVYPIAQRFADVAPSHPFYGYIEFFGQAGVTTGCGGGLFCPDASVNRDQMAVFLERVKRASNWIPPAAGDLFADVPASHPFADWIAALYNDGITSGCTAVPLQYCPLNPVTRGQMAVFVLRASCGASYVPAAPAVQRFADVPPSHPFYAFIDKFARLGVTSGCNATGYCPDNPVTRGQMAVFIERSFPFLTPSDTCSP